MRFAELLVVLVVFGLVGQLRSQDGPETVLRPVKRFRKRVVTSELQGPWELTWDPDAKLWVTERTGKRITRIDPSTGERSIAVRIHEVSAPGGQDGLLGMALHPELLKGTDNDYVYAAYTYVDKRAGADPAVTDPKSPYRYLYAKVVRLTYSANTGRLSHAIEVIGRLPAGDDHVAGRLKFGPDGKLYLSLGDQGANQFGNICMAVPSQRLPTAREVEERDYSSYAGKVLRLNLDGSIPKDSPQIEGVISHVFTYGHRNTQGIDFAPDGTLYASEHGPKTDDGINILKPGANYGWPNVAGWKINKAYEYARKAEARTPCSKLKFSGTEVPASVPREQEAAFQKPFAEPIATMFTVPANNNFQNPACRGIDFICWPTVAPSSIEHYESRGTGIPGWDRVLLVPTLKRGSLYVVPLRADGKATAGFFSRYFPSENRYRDTAVSPDGRTIFVATDPGGLAEGLRGGATSKMQNASAILAFTYAEEGAELEEPAVVSESRPAAAETPGAPTSGGMPPQFTTAQAAERLIFPNVPSATAAP